MEEIMLPKKTEDWYSSVDLAKLLGGGSSKYATYLKQVVNMPEFKDTVKQMQCGTIPALCLHKGGLELFKENFDIKDLLKKTEDWYSSLDLSDLLVGNSTKYKKCLEQAVKMPEFKDTVKLMQSSTRQTLCIHKDALELFKQNFGILDLSNKTEDWYSTYDLANLLVGNSTKYKKCLEQAVKMPEFKDTVKLIKSGAHSTLCLHVDGLELFKQTFGILSQKTEDWYSANDLGNLLGGNEKKYADYLKQAVKMSEFKDVVKLMQSANGIQSLCLHKDGLELFKETFGIKEKQKDLPKKTEDWYSSTDLGKLLGGDPAKYKKLLEQAVKMPEFKDTVKLMQCFNKQSLCIHENGLELFKEIVVKDLPKKTEDWYSSIDLSELLSGGHTKYANYLEQAVNMPEFMDKVKQMQSGKHQVLCLHKDGLIDFVQKFNIKIKDTKIFDEATKKIEQKIIEEKNINKNLNQIEENNPIIDIDWDNIIEEENSVETEKELPKTLILEYKIKKISEAVEGRINSSDKKIIKNAHNNTCMCCNVNYSGNPTMLEVHHKKQFKDLNVGEKRTLHLSDFFTLCADCHDSIHQLKDVGDEGLKQLRWWYKKNKFTEEFDEKQYNKENNILNVKQNER